MLMETDEADYFQNPTKLFKQLEEKDWESALHRVALYPNEAKIWISFNKDDGSSSWKRLPIHEACMHAPTSALISALLKASPNSCREIDSTRRLPIHYACSNNASIDVVQKLLLAYPDSLKHEDIWFKTPEHCLNSSTNPDPVVLAALKKGPDYFKKKGQDIAKNKAMRDRSEAHQTTKSTSNEISMNRYNERGIYTDRISYNKGPSTESKDNVIASLEKEISHFSERLANSLDKENDLKLKVERSTKELEKQKKEINNLLKLVNKLEDDKSRMSRDLHELKSDKMSVNDVYQQTESRLKGQLENARNDISDKTAQIEKLKIQIVDLQTKLTDAIDTMKLAEETFMNERNGSSDIQYELRRAENEIASLQKILNAREHEFQMKIQKHEELLSKIYREHDEERREQAAKLARFEDKENELKEMEKKSNKLLVKVQKYEKMVKMNAKEFDQERENMLRDIDALTKENERLRMTEDENRNIMKEMEGLDNHLFSKDEEIKHMREHMNMLEDENRGMRNENASLHSELSHLSNTLSMKMEQLDNAMSDIDHFQSAMEAKDEENHILVQKMEEIEKENADLAQFSNEKRSLQEKICTLEQDNQEVSKLRSDANKYRDEASKLSLELRSVKDKLNTVENELKSVKIDADRQYDKNNYDRERERSELLERLDIITNEKNDVLNDLRREKTAIEEARFHYERTLSKLDDEIEEKRMTISELSLENRIVQEKLQDMEKEKERYLEERSEYKRSQNEIAKLSRSTKELKDELNSTKDKLFSLENELRDARFEKDQANRQCKSFQNQFKSLQDRMVKVSNGATFDQENELIAQRRIFEQDMDELKMEIKDLIEERFGLKQQNIALSSEVERLKDDFRALQERMEGEKTSFETRAENRTNTIKNDSESAANYGIRQSDSMSNRSIQREQLIDINQNDRDRTFERRQTSNKLPTDSVQNDDASVHSYRSQHSSYRPSAETKQHGDRLEIKNYSRSFHEDDRHYDTKQSRYQSSYRQSVENQRPSIASNIKEPFRSLSYSQKSSSFHDSSRTLQSSNREGRDDINPSNPSRLPRQSQHSSRTYESKPSHGYDYPSTIPASVVRERVLDDDDDLSLDASVTGPLDPNISMSTLNTHNYSRERTNMTPTIYLSDYIVSGRFN